MNVDTTIIGDNPFSPGITSYAYKSDQLIAGDLKMVTDMGLISQSPSVLKRGTLMGQVTGSNKWLPSLKSAADGSEKPAGVLADVIDATSSDVMAGIYVMGEFNFDWIVFDPSWGVGQAAFDALNSACRPNGIYLKQPCSAADPT